MRTVVFMNTRSRRTRKVMDRLKEDLADSQFEFVAFITCSSSGRFKAGLERLRQTTGLECVIIAGGDGTIAAVINAVKDLPRLRVGILPLGTANTFARSLGVPLNYSDAIAIVKAGRAKQVALGRVNDNVFVSSAAIGLSAVTLGRISNRTKRYFGIIAYLISGIKVLLTHRPFQCTLETPEKTYRFKTHEVFIANGPYHGNMPIDEHTSVYKDYLTFVAVGTEANRWQYTKSQLLLFLGRSHIDKGALKISARQATITTVPRRQVHADGEITTKTPAKFEIKPKAVTVFVP